MVKSPISVSECVDDINTLVGGCDRADEYCDMEDYHCVPFSGKLGLIFLHISSIAIIKTH